MPYPICRHIKEDGCLCKSPAMRGRPHCFFHSNHRARRMAMAQARARGEQYWLDLPPLEDMQAVQSAIDRVVQALNAGVLEHKTAQLMLAGLRIAAMNFRAVKAWTLTSQYENQGHFESVASYPVEQMHGLPHDIDLDAPPEQMFAGAAPNDASSEAGVSGSKSKKQKAAKTPRRKPIAIETERGLMDMIRDEEDPVEALKDYVRSIFGQPTKTPLFDEILGIVRKPPASVGDAEVEEENVDCDAEVGA